MQRPERMAGVGSLVGRHDDKQACRLLDDRIVAGYAGRYACM